ncbi:uncharacterized protein RJT21DRAFT_79936 [Scheffersomyces amazonensis]|uniref:uncharacterized protein n=1 Tax=Scheffersomyces amazonensis TaxID=1078765 RepID=UPI00315D692A
MPLELESNHSSIGEEEKFEEYEFSTGNTYQELTDLRVSLIGNKDLKFKLVGDVKFIQSLVKDFNNSIETIVTNSTSNILKDNEFLQDLEKRAVIIDILCSFITEVNTKKYSNITICLESLENVINPTIELLNFFLNKFVPNIDNPQILKNVENLMSYCLDIFLGLSNIRNHNVDSEKLWRFITTLLIITDSNQMNTVIDSSLLIKSLRLIPILLSTNKLSNNALKTLLTAVLKRLSNECTILIDIHFPNVSQDSVILNQLAFEDSTLPNIELNKSILKSRINLNLLLELMTCTAQIFSYSKKNDYSILMELASSSTPKISPVVVLTIQVYISLLLLVKYEDNSNISLIALNLIYFYLNNLRPSDEVDDQIIFKSYKKLFPKIIEMLELEDNNSIKKNNRNLTHSSNHNNTANLVLPMYLYSPARILADLCVQYPLLSDKIKDSNIDIKIVKKLEIQFRSSQFLMIINKLKKKSKHGKTIVDFTILLSILNDEDKHINSSADLLLLLSVYTSTIEEYRTRVINSNDLTKANPLFAQMIFEIIDNYHFLLVEIQLIYKLLKNKMITSKDLPWFGRNLGIINSIIDNPLYTNCLYLIRSLARSIKPLRTFFVECNSLNSFIYEDESGKTSGGLITNFLQILKSFESIDIMNQYFNHFLRNDGDEQITSVKRYNKIQMTNKSITLGLLANFILDFSSFRYIIVTYDNFLQSLKIIYERHDPSRDNISNTNEEIYQKNIIQLNVLYILKNFMYNEVHENKRDLLQYFSLNEILLKTLYGIIEEEEEDNNNDINENDEKNKKLIADIKRLRLQQKLIAFDTLRNYTAGSTNFNTILIETYENDLVCKYPQYNLPKKWYEFLILNITTTKIFAVNRKNSSSTISNDDEYLSRLILNDDYSKMIVAINSIENNRYAVVVSMQREFFPDKDLLKLWLKFLAFQIPRKILNKLSLNEKIFINNNLNEIKLSIVCIIVNLTWRSSTHSFRGHDSANYDSFDLVQDSQLRSGLITTSGTNRRLFLEDSSESVRERSEDFDGYEKHDDENNKKEEKSSDELSVTDRAELLQQFGFEDVIIRLINEYSKSSSVASSTNSTNLNDSPKRFDVYNSHNLSEKLKNAHIQLSTLLYRRGRGSVGNAGLGNGEDEEAGHEDDESRRRRRRRLRAGGNVALPDVNRGGEGYGYGSDDEYGPDYIDVEGGEEEDDDDEDEDVEGEDDHDDDEDEDEDEEVDDDDHDDEETAREYWIA